MSGIVGIMKMRDKSVRYLESDFVSMLDSLADSRGDFVATVKDGDHLLGVVNSNNVQGGIQYYTNQDRSIHCMIDGDVFIDDAVQQEISRCYGIRGDARSKALVPLLYENSGTDFIGKVKGWFNILIYDSKDRIYHLINSRLGMRPLYYHKASGYFVFSSQLASMLRCSLIKRRINKKSVADYALFNYPLGSETYVEGVSLQAPASVLTIKDSCVTQKFYWSPKSLFTRKLVPRGESLIHAEKLLRTAVNKMHADTATVGVALTGGFDGRTVLSLIDKEKENLILYSFGAPGSKDISIPRAISRQLSYVYIPIHLDHDYGLNIFTEYAKKCIVRSDCRSTLARAHYLYAVDVLSRRVGVVLTGNCGSELIRPVHLTGEVISNNMKVLFSRMNAESLACIFDRFFISKYFERRSIYELKDTICECLADTAEIAEDELTLNQKFYLFLVKEVFRKYFGTEMAMEDGYVYNRSPYLDNDFVDFIFKTPLCGANYDFFVNNPFVRINGQLLYAQIISNSNKSLARFPTSKLYAPNDLLTDFGRLRAGFSFFYRRFFGDNSDGFGLELGVESFMHENSEEMGDVEFLNTQEILNDFRDGSWKKHKLDFYKAISWAYWYKQNFAP